MAAYTAVTWLEGLPARVPTFPPAKTILELGWSVPAALTAWVDQHRKRPDVVALG
jgi:hypothetical protein